MSWQRCVRIVHRGPGGATAVRHAPSSAKDLVEKPRMAITGLEFYVHLESCHRTAFRFLASPEFSCWGM